MKAVERPHGPREAGDPARASARVRPLARRDLPAVLALYERVFPNRRGRRREAAAHLEEILCRAPWADPALPSLVCEDGAGRIAGCLGVMPRCMSLGGRPIRAAVTHTFMVEPGSRAGLSALEMARTLLLAGQDLSIAEGGDRSRRILERLGGTTALLYSLRWTRPLRQSRYLLSYLERHGLPAPLSRALTPLCRAADALAPSLLGGSLRLARPQFTETDLATDDLVGCLSWLSADRGLRPQYERESLGWLLDLLGARKDRGAFQRVAVRDGRGEILGWYLYYLNPGGISEVVQVGGRTTFLGDVLDHLFHRAWRGGAAAVSGQLDPAAFQALAAKGCVFHHDGVSWFLVHSRHAEILSSIQRGDAFLTRLEGEWCIRP